MKSNFFVYYQSKRYYPVLVVQKDFALWGNTPATALLRNQNLTVPFGLIVLSNSKRDYFVSAIREFGRCI